MSGLLVLKEMSLYYSMPSVSVYHNGTEVTVKLFANSSAKIVIDSVEFTGKSPTPKLNHYAFIDEPKQVSPKLNHYAFIDDYEYEQYLRELEESRQEEMEIDAPIARWDAEIIGPINEPPPPYYETEINDGNEVPPYTLPFCLPPDQQNETNTTALL